MRPAHSKRDRVPPTEKRAQELRDDIRTAVEKYEALLIEFRAAETAYAQALLNANREGLTWKEVAQAAGLDSENQARVRAERAMTDEEISPGRRRRKDASPRPQAPGVSVMVAAGLWGVSRTTIYKMIDQGDLETVTDHLGRTRVVSEPPKKR